MDIKYPTEQKRNKLWKLIWWNVYILMFHSESHHIMIKKKLLILGKILSNVQLSVSLAWQYNWKYQSLWNFKRWEMKSIWDCAYDYE